jgi:predicted PurR-regulated permease PerM
MEPSPQEVLPPDRGRPSSWGPASIGTAVLAGLGIVAFLYYAASVVITILSSILIATALDPLVRFLGRRARLPRSLVSMLVVFSAVVLLYGLVSSVSSSALQLFSDLPTLTGRVRNAPLVEKIAREAKNFTETLQEAGRTIAPPPPQAKGGRGKEAVVIREGVPWVETVLRGIGSLTSLVFSLSFIPFLVYFILAEKEALTARTIRLFPDREEPKVQSVLKDIEGMMQKFLVGNAIIAAILSAATLLVFWIIGLPYWIVLGILSGIANTIPYLGLVLALAPAVLVGLVTFDSGVPFAVLVASVSILHVIAANLLTPKLVGSRTHLNAVTSTIALMFFGWLWGGMGLLLAIPVAATLKNVLENIPSTQPVGLWMGEGRPETPPPHENP